MAYISSSQIGSKIPSELTSGSDPRTTGSIAATPGLTSLNGSILDGGSYNINRNLDQTKNYITNISLDKRYISASATEVNLKVEGDQNATFSLTIKRSSDTKMYDFSVNSFQNNYSLCRLTGQRMGVVKILLPADANAETYTFNIHADAHNDTRILFGENHLFFSTTVSQVVDTSVTITAIGSGITDTALHTFSGGSPANDSLSSVFETKILEKSQITTPTATSNYGFGIKVKNGIWGDSALAWRTTENNVGGTAGDSTQVVVADLTGIVEEMELEYITGTTAPGAKTTITSIDRATKTLTLSRTQAITSGHTMTFKASGSRLIKKASGIGINVSNATVLLNDISTSIRDDYTSNVTAGSDIRVNGTVGISKGATVRMRGLNKSSSSSACVVSAVSSPHLTQGSIRLSNGQLEASSTRPIHNGTKIHIDGYSSEVFLSAKISIDKFPIANETIYINMDEILTQGTAS